MILHGFLLEDVAAAFSNKTAPGVSYRFFLFGIGKKIICTTRTPFSKVGNKATMGIILPFP